MLGVDFVRQLYDRRVYMVSKRATVRRQECVYVEFSVRPVPRMDDWFEQVPSGDFGRKVAVWIFQVSNMFGF